MHIYTLMRAFADSWMLLALFLFFLTVIVWVFRPSSKSEYQDISNIPLRNDDAPAGDANQKEA